MRRQWVAIPVGVVALAAAAFFVARLKPAAPEVERATVWMDTVKRGPLLQLVRGPGTLVPREDKIRLIPAETEGTVVRIRVLPGAKVQPDTILLDLVDPTLQQELLDAQLQLKGAQADYINTRAKVESDLMDQKAAAATVVADHNQAQLQAKTDKSLYDLGVISGLTYSASKGKADDLVTRNDLEKQRLTLNEKAIETQLSVQQTKVDQARALLALKQKQSDALSVRAGISGVLVELDHQVGEHVTAGTTLAKVVQPDQLKASLKIAETQARDIQIGQPAEIDTHNGVIDGKVTRIDPACLTELCRGRRAGWRLAAGSATGPERGWNHRSELPPAGRPHRGGEHRPSFVVQEHLEAGTAGIGCGHAGPLNIVGKKDLYPSQLSGGQQQLVGIARAMIHRPSLLLADEPTGNLQSAQAKEIMEMFRLLNEEGATIVQVTHSEANAQYGTRIIELRDGWIYADSAQADANGREVRP